MKRHFDEELNKLQIEVVDMTSLVKNIITAAISALNERDLKIIDNIFEQENIINKKHLEIDDICLKLLALYQPTAIDLRVISSTMKINAELERIGDQAVNISQNIILLLKQPQFLPLLNISEMIAITKGMLEDSINAFINRDVKLAYKTLSKDDEVDKLKYQILKEVISYKNKEILNVEYFISFLLMSRNLERIADHTTNICEDIIFLVQGKDIRHPPKDLHKHLHLNDNL